ncbi:uncharacterized protein LOC132756767 [Ruditapes philippinarum]|uniref:uncharacterized protein LOC132756767 n=1 Tax=Ruditapes philippinarum TaxID=129788 RepID=UPI00295C0981|nr:uncharacterized protein LOC132756767 [Ruditapes philippinarum]
MAFSVIASAAYHQGAECLPAQARGRQCVPCSVMYLITVKFIKPVRSLNKNDLNDILHAGSYLYCAIHYKNSITTDFIHPEEIPKRIYYQKQRVSVIHKGVISGVIGLVHMENGPFLQTLECALLNSCVPSKYLVLIFNGTAVGIHCDGTSFFVFDGHSRNVNGRWDINGTAICGVLHSIDAMCAYFRSLVISLGKEPSNVQFDLHQYNLIKYYKEAEYAVEILYPRFDFRICNTKRKRSFECKMDMPQYVASLVQSRSFVDVIDDISISSEENKVIRKFHKLVSVGPDFVCSSCTQTFFKHSVRTANTLPNEVRRKFLSNIKSVDSEEWICLNCWTSLKKEKTPKFWLHNGLRFPIKPDELQLTDLEERLVSPRLPFMQVREMPRGGQLNLRGNVVNVPASVSNTIKSLPRMLNEDETIMLKLKRKLAYKHHVAFENIRPNKVFDAAKWLVSNSALFRSEGIVVNETWLDQPQEAFNKEDDQDKPTTDCSADIDTWTEDENFNDRPTGNMDTCLQSLDFREFNQVVCVAPGENNKPLALFYDTYSEILSFPTIFCGQSRVSNLIRQVPLHYSDICKWELRNVDRRVALCVPNIFYKLKKLQIKQIKDKVTLAVRKCKLKGQTLTVEKMLSPEFVDNLTMQNDGYRVLRTLRGSPPYWEQAKRDLFSMIRQIGLPTWFCSFSAAETKWKPLLKTLVKFVDRKDITLEATQELSWLEKCRLIKNDPVTCARYFDFRVQSFIRDVLKHMSNPIGEIKDFFYRVEFQQRGSPHIHMLAWVKNAPLHGSNADSEVVEFIDKYVSCMKDESIPELINYQTHRHASACRKNGKNVCRFNFPLFPMPETCILYPLPDIEKSSDLVQKSNEVITTLNDLHKENTDISFQDFLEKLGMDFNLYITVVRSTLSKATVFLKRAVSESRINHYNKVLIRSWEANMDIQYVLDAYSCVSYIVSYISKGQRGLSNLLRDACNEAQQQESDIRQRVRRIGNQFLSSVEIGAQEAVYLVLQMPLRRCTRNVIYVDTKQPDERTSLIKSQNNLKDLPLSSTEVEMDSTLKRYKRRPKCMENLCYADFAAWYDLCPGRKQEKVAHIEEDLPETEYEHDKDDDLEPCGSVDYEKKIRFPCGTCVRKRKRQKVIYTHVASITQDKEEFFRQKLMLYSPWRNEEDLLQYFSTHEGSYNAKRDEIILNEKQYENCSVDDSLEVLEYNYNSVININSEIQFQEAVDVNNGNNESLVTECFDASQRANSFIDYDIGEDIGIQPRSQGSEVMPFNEVSDDAYLQQVRSLNHEQKQFFYHILSKIKKQSLPFYTFLSGGAGVGKSVVTRCLYQGLMKYLNHKRNEIPDAVKLLMCAPTGKAAHNIGGLTIHSAFCIPANQGFQFKPLDMQQLNSMRARYHSLKMIIIDEISMVGRGMFNFINLRLQEIMGCQSPFGNVSVLAVGDLFQLKPVMDSWIFSQSYSSLQMNCLGPSLWVDLFDFFELKIVMRQKDDQSFAELLNRLRENLCTENDLKVLRSRQIENTTSTSFQGLPHLFCRRQDSAAHNQLVLEKTTASDLVSIMAIDDVSGGISRELQETIISRIPDDSTLSMGLQKKLTLGVNLPAEICVNVDTSDGLTNGASCQVKKFDFRVPGSKRCSIVWVEFEDVSVGRKWRLQYKHLFSSNTPSAWTPILETSRRFTYRYFKTYLITRRQFPLCMSAAKTIHKAQGSTMKAAVLHFGKRKIEHIHYVGLSRVTNLSQIHITELNLNKICVSKEVEKEMERLRKNKYISYIPALETFPQGVMKVCFHNCRSLNRHFEDMKLDRNLTSADIIGLSETRVWNTLDERFMLEGFQVIASSQEQAAHGLVLFYKSSLDIELLCNKTISSIEYTLVGINHAVVIGFVYCPPKSATVSSLTQFLSAVSANLVNYLLDKKNCKLVLMGDFNFELTGHENLTKLFKEICMLNHLETKETTDYGTCIDHIYSSLCQNDIFDFGTLESYYSDHKPIFLAFSL